MSTATRSGTGRAGPQVAGVSLGPDAGLLIVRLLIGGLLMGHGLGKLFGWFRQPGMKGTGAFFEKVGYPHGEPLAILSGIVEFGGGLLLAIGLLVPLGAAMIIGDMMNAAWVQSANGFWSADDGWEYNLVLSTIVFAITVAGPGAYAIDRSRDWFRNRTGGVVVAVVLGVVAGGIMMIIRN